MEDNNAIFAERLKAAMKAKDYNNASLARDAGMSAAAVGNYVKGRLPRGCDEIIRLARTLGTTPNYLLGFSDEKSADNEPENYEDYLRLIDIITNRFLFSYTRVVGINELTISIRDEKLCTFIAKRDKLIDALGSVIKPERYNLLIGDLNEEMRKEHLPELPDLPF